MDGKKNRNQERSCGSCTACCTYLEIKSGSTRNLSFDTAEDLSKPAGITCRHCTNTGCGIYENRPIVCREFRCDWLEGRKNYQPKDSPMEVGYIGVRGDRVACTK